MPTVVANPELPQKVLDFIERNGGWVAALEYVDGLEINYAALLAENDALCSKSNA